jgi:hypothetical protein
VGWIATRQDLIARGGLPAAAYQPDSRLVDAFHFDTQLVELRGHGLSGASVRFTARAGATLPSGLPTTSPGWIQVAQTTDPDFFSLVNVTLTDDGSGAIVVLEDFWPKIDAMLLDWTSYVVAHAKAYLGPWTTPPDWAPGLVARLVAHVAASALRLPEARYPIDDLRKAHEVALEFCDVLNKGEPFPDGVGPIDTTPTIAEAGAVLVHLRRGDFDLRRGELDIA